MEYEDRITIATPEGIELQYTLAGLGSRLIAAILDLVVRLAALAAIYGVLAAFLQGVAGAIIFLIATFLAVFGYDIAFEVWGGGRTPGKRWSGLRVMMVTGQPVGFGPSAVRNVMRIIDIYVTVFIAGIVSIIATKRNQRLGDLAASTIVVRERQTVVKPSPRARSSAPPGPAVTAGIDVTAVTMAELAAVRDFLARRDSLKDDARARVGAALATGLSGKVGGLPPGGLPPERLLEAIAAAKSVAR